MNSKEAEVFAPLADLFRGLYSKDEALMRSVLIPEGSATIYRDGQFLKMSLAQLVDRLMTVVQGPSRFEEVMDAPVIHIDDNVAVIWGAYTVSKDGVPQTCGSNVISVIHENGRWQIASVTDTKRPVSLS